MAALSVERVVLRAAIGDRNYGRIELLAAVLDQLERGGAISAEGVGNVISVLADEIVIASVAREFAADLSERAEPGDTPATEDPT